MFTRVNFFFNHLLYSGVAVGIFFIILILGGWSLGEPSYIAGFVAFSCCVALAVIRDDGAGFAFASLAIAFSVAAANIFPVYGGFWGVFASFVGGAVVAAIAFLILSAVNYFIKEPQYITESDFVPEEFSVFIRVAEFVVVAVVVLVLLGCA